MNDYLKNGKRVLFFVDGFVGGAGNVVQILAKCFADSGCVVEICCFGGTTQGRHDLSGVSVVGIDNKKKKAIKDFSYTIAAKREINRFCPDCVISFLFGVSAFSGIAIKKTRDYLFVASERSDPSSLRPHGIVQKLVRSAYKKADGIVVLFDAFKDLEDGFFKNKCYTIPNPVPVLTCDTTRTSNRSMTFVTIANESFPKGLDLLLEAFSSAVEKEKDIQLKIYGNIHTDMIPCYIAQHDLKDNIHLMGYTQSVQSALQDADVYIMPSRHEGFPNSLCEAMSAGKACIAFECHKGISELITNGEDGIVVPPEDVHAMTDRIIWIAEHPEMVRFLGDNAKLIVERYSLESVVLKWDKLLAYLSEHHKS